MALYLGLHEAQITKGLRDDESVLDSIIDGTIGEYYNPFISEIGSYAFADCTVLTSINLGQTTMVGNYAFVDCSALTSINLPKAETIGSYAFASCFALTSINLPKAKTIGNYAFRNCIALTSINLPKAEIIGNYAFRYCYHLLSVYLLGSSIPTLATDAFYSTPISQSTASTGGAYGSIYVPASLYSSYLTATGWSVYSARFVSR